jgi:hypothetical protein
VRTVTNPYAVDISASLRTAWGPEDGGPCADLATGSFGGYGSGRLWRVSNRVEQLSVWCVVHTTELALAGVAIAVPIVLGSVRNTRGCSRARRGTLEGASDQRVRHSRSSVV